MCLAAVTNASPTRASFPIRCECTRLAVIPVKKYVMHSSPKKNVSANAILVYLRTLFSSRGPSSSGSYCSPAGALLSAETTVSPDAPAPSRFSASVLSDSAALAFSA